MASYQVKVDLIFGEKGIVRGALLRNKINSLTKTLNEAGNPI